MARSSAKIVLVSVLIAVPLSWGLATMRSASAASGSTLEAQPAEAAYRVDERSIQNSLSRLLTSVESIASRVSALEERVAKNLNGSTRDEEAAADEGEAQTPPSKEEVQALVERRVRYFDETFAQETRDPVWSREMEQVVNKAFADGDFAGTTLKSAACKQTFCRIEAEHVDAPSSMQFELLKRGVPGSYYLQHINDEDGARPRTVLYFLRANHLDKNAAFTELRQNGSFEE